MNVTREQAVFLFFVCLLFYLPYLLTGYVGEWDSYYYLSLFGIPTDLFYLVKLVTFVLFFVSVLFIALLGGVFFKEGWLAGVFCLASPGFIQLFWRFENDVFAFPFVFCSMWLFFSGKKFLSIVSLAVGFFFWQGSALLLIPYSILFWPLLFASIPLIVVIYFQYLENFLPNLGVVENFPFLAVFLCFFSLFGLAAIPRKLKVATFFFFVVALANAKWSVFLFPLLGVGLAGVWSSRGQFFRNVAFMAVVVSFLISLVLVFVFPPTFVQVEAIRFAIEDSNGELIYNDWTVGHVVEYYGGRALARSGGLQPDLNCSDCVVLTVQDSNCDCVNSCELPLSVFRC